jgi:hypothetical protein
MKYFEEGEKGKKNTRSAVFTFMWNLFKSVQNPNLVDANDIL